MVEHYLKDLAGGRRQRIDLAPDFQEGAAGRVHRVVGRPGIVVKLYKNPPDLSEYQPKVAAMLKAPPRNLAAFKDQGREFVQLAWPTAEVVDRTGRFLGFAMPEVDFAASTALENILQRSARRSRRLPEFLGFRVNLAFNLAVLIKELHVLGHYMIDMKPINTRFYPQNSFMAIIDADGFSISGSPRFASHHYTPDYIAPEAQAKKPEDLGEEQDLFALAVIIFQLLNNGIHPYQGIDRGRTSHPTETQGRIYAGLYAYGRMPSRDVGPALASIHEYLEEGTRDLFDRAFAGPAASRPEAAEWADHLRVLRNTVRRCAANGDHGHFSRACGQCVLDQRRATARPAPPNPPPQPPPFVANPPPVGVAPLAPPPPFIQWPPPGRRRVGLVLTALIIAALGWHTFRAHPNPRPIGDASSEAAKPIVPPPPTVTNPVPLQSAPVDRSQDEKPNATEDVRKDTSVENIYNRAFSYQSGHGVVQDAAKAKALYRLAAERGQVPSMLAVAALASIGQGGPKDCNEAKYWWDKAIQEDANTAENWALKAQTRSLCPLIEDPRELEAQRQIHLQDIQNKANQLAELNLRIQSDSDLLEGQKRALATCANLAHQDGARLNLTQSSMDYYADTCRRTTLQQITGLEQTISNLKQLVAPLTLPDSTSPKGVFITVGTCTISSQTINKSVVYEVLNQCKLQASLADDRNGVAKIINIDWQQTDRPLPGPFINFVPQQRSTGMMTETWEYEPASGSHIEMTAEGIGLPPKPGQISVSTHFVAYSKFTLARAYWMSPAGDVRCLEQQPLTQEQVLAHLYLAAQYQANKVLVLPEYDQWVAAAERDIDAAHQSDGALNRAGGVYRILGFTYDTAETALSETKQQRARLSEVMQQQKIHLAELPALNQASESGWLRSIYNYRFVVPVDVYQKMASKLAQFSREILQSRDELKSNIESQLPRTEWKNYLPTLTDISSRKC